MLPYGSAFDTMNPKKGYCVESFTTEFPDILDRARVLLSKRSAKEIRVAAAIIDWLVNEQSRELQFTYLMAAAKAADEGSKSDHNWPHSPTAQLLLCLEHVELDDKDEFPNATVAEFVAVLALCLVGLACEEQKYLFNKGADDTKPRYWLNIGTFAIEAMEAVVTAEFLARHNSSELPHNVNIDLEVKKKISLQNSQAIRKRYEPIRKLKSEFFNWYGSHEESGLFHSKSQAAEKFYNGLPPDKKGLLVPSNATRTLLDGLREYLRESD